MLRICTEHQCLKISQRSLQSMEVRDCDVREAMKEFEYHIADLQIDGSQRFHLWWAVWSLKRSPLEKSRMRTTQNRCALSLART